MGLQIIVQWCVKAERMHAQQDMWVDAERFGVPSRSLCTILIMQASKLSNPLMSAQYWGIWIPVMDDQIVGTGLVCVCVCVCFLFCLIFDHRSNRSTICDKRESITLSRYFPCVPLNPPAPSRHTWYGPEAQVLPGR